MAYYLIIIALDLVKVIQYLAQIILIIFLLLIRLFALTYINCKNQNTGFLLLLILFLIFLVLFLLFLLFGLFKSCNNINILKNRLLNSNLNYFFYQILYNTILSIELGHNKVSLINISKAIIINFLIYDLRVKGCFSLSIDGFVDHLLQIF